MQGFTVRVRVDHLGWQYVMQRGLDPDAELAKAVEIVNGYDLTGDMLIEIDAMSN